MAETVTVVRTELARLPAFDYASVGRNAAWLRRKAVEGRRLGRKTVESIVRLGELLIEVRQRIAAAGNESWTTWVRCELGLSDGFVSRAMQAAKLVRRHPLDGASVAPSALYLLGAGSTPQSITAEILDDARRTGRHVTHKFVRGRLLDAERQAELPASGVPANLAGSWSAAPCQIVHGSARATGLPEGSIRCCVTSPPYFNQRAGTAAEEWPAVTYRPMPGLGSITVPPMTVPLGRETDPTHYVGHLVLIFRECRRLLQDDGTLWVNLADTTAQVSRGAGGEGRQHTNLGSVVRDRRAQIPDGLKPKDLLWLPARLAMALQGDGWWSRSWAPYVKRAAMPSSVRDRPGPALEHWLMFSKAETYQYDADAVRLPSRNRRDSDWWFESLRGLQLDRPIGMLTDPDGLPLGFDFTTGRQPTGHTATYPVEMIDPIVRACTRPGDTVYDPFTGSGTTALAALGLGRRFVGTELSPVYVELANGRVAEWHRTQAGDAPVRRAS